jgi:ribosomal protein S18 acetylase RimI-like enzyme
MLKRDIRAGIMTQMRIAVRPATAADPADDLLYLSAKPYYDAYAGSEARARALVAAVYRRRGHAASFEVCEVAEVDGELAGVMASFPVSEGDERARRFVSLTAPRVPPWGWPALLRHLRAAGSVSPHPPPGMLYVDALAVAPAFRRRGVASVLLARAEAAAAASELDGVALDTGLQNEPARALYAATGYREREIRRAPSAAAAAAIGGPGFVSYLKRL